MELRVPWYSIADEPAQVAAMSQELRRELSVGHPLYGLPVRATGRRQDSDDVLYAIEDGSGRFAVVHLTWWQSLPERPPWPWTVIYDSFDAWLAEGMQSDHDLFLGRGNENPGGNDTRPATPSPPDSI